MKRVNHYNISCQAYGRDISKLDGTYIVKVKLDKVLDASYVKVKDTSEGLDIINDLIKGLKFKVLPDLNVYNSKILGPIIVAEN
jgi:hypothetical protein